MTLTPEQKQAVSSWIAAGDNLSAVQKKLIELFQITLTYRDVRFLVDDLNLELKDPAPKVDANDVSKLAPKAESGAQARHPAAAAELDQDAPAAGEMADELAEPGAEEELGDAPGGSSVTVEVDKVTLIPGALASGKVTFSGGVTGKWVVDQQGRPGLTEISQPGYRPSPAEGQAFMRELSAQLQRRGF